MINNSTTRFYFGAVAVLCMLCVACGKDNAPKVPLGHQQARNELVGAAKVALDSGNALFRAKAYEGALAQYQRASELAPSETAPILGILMVADVTRNAKLSESTLARLRKLDPSLADSSAVTPHSQMMRQHPKVPPPASG